MDVQESFCIGIDYGTDSVRAVAINARTGEEVGQAVFAYPRWSTGQYCDAATNIFRQSPHDYIEGLEYLIPRLLSDTGIRPEWVRGMGFDTTGSTSCPVNKEGIPLGLLAQHAQDPDAQFYLWKDHSGVAEAERINELAHSGDFEDYTKYSGGVYSAEWYWTNMLYLFRRNSRLATHVFAWVEHCDWISALVVGDTRPEQIFRSRCAAGHKAMWNENFALGLPDPAFLAVLHPDLPSVYRYTKTHSADTPVGTLCAEWAEKLQLHTDVVVSSGIFDAHAGAVGAGCRPYDLVRVMGTSTCDILAAPKQDIGNKIVSGICGQVDGSVLPDMIGFEAGQSAFGDIFAWFHRLLSWMGRFSMDTDQLQKNLLPELERDAAQLAPQKHLLAMDWFNGRRTPHANQALESGIIGLNLSTTTAMVYRALIEGACFGAKRILDQFETFHIPVQRVLGVGGVAKKSGLLMQCLADILERECLLIESDQCCARGAAIFAACAAGIYPSVQAAQEGMASRVEQVYVPQDIHRSVYRDLYAQYQHFGTFLEGLYSTDG